MWFSIYKENKDDWLLWIAERYDHKIIVQQWVLDNRFSMVKYLKRKIKDFILSSH